MVLDLVVVGGGAVGLSIAWEAANRGWRVGLIEQRQLGGGASWAGAGILPPGARREVFDPLEALRAASHAAFPEWCSRLESESGIDVGFRRCGGVYLARSPAEKATLRANQAWWDDHGIEYRRLAPSELHERVPTLADRSEGLDHFEAWYLRDECQLRNPRYIQALATACRKRGVLILEEDSFRALEATTTGTYFVSTDHARHATHRVCFSAGAWTALIAPAMQIETEVFPVRGQMVLFKLDRRPFESVVNEGHRYLVPRDDGYILAGSCEEEVGFDERTTAEMIEQLSVWAIELAPVLKSATIEKSWAGLRPGSVDGLPYLGELPTLPKCYIAAGHYRHGIHFSPITAVGMVDIMSNQSPPMDFSPFRVLRGKTYGK